MNDMLKTDRWRPCSNCGHLTRFVDIYFEVRLHSGSCYRETWARFWEIVRS